MDDIVEAYCTYVEKPNAESHTLFISQLDTKKHETFSNIVYSLMCTGQL